MIHELFRDFCSGIISKWDGTNQFREAVCGYEQISVSACRTNELSRYLCSRLFPLQLQVAGSLLVKLYK